MSRMKLVLLLLLALPISLILSSNPASTLSAIASSPSVKDADVAIITGQVTDEIYEYPLYDVDVFLIDPDEPSIEILAATTDFDGSYTITRPISNTWVIKFVPRQSQFNNLYLGEYYDNAITLAEATPITAEVGTVTANINAVLSTKGQISGRVTSAIDGTPIANVTVSSFSASNSQPILTTMTNEQGIYRLTTNTSQQQKLLFTPSHTSKYALEYYNNALTLAEATIVTSQIDRPVYDIDVALVEGGIIKGFVTSSSHIRGLRAPMVQVYNEAGELIQSGYRENYEPLSYYAATNLPAGNYSLIFSAQHHATMQYPISITVQSGKVTENINMRLRKFILTTAIATSPSAPGVIGISFSGDPTPLLTRDSGISWRPLSSSNWIVDTDIFSYADNIVEVSVNTAIAPRGLPGEGTRLIAIVGGMQNYGYLNQGVYRSGDYGEGWASSELQTTSSAKTCEWIGTHHVKISPANPSTLYILNQCAPGVPFALFVSKNGGVTWNDMTMVGGRVLRLSPNIEPSPVVVDRIYAMDEMGKWLQSDDAGQNWTEKSFDIEVLAPDSQNENILHGLSTIQNGADGASTRLGKRSMDGGTTWQEWAEQPCPYASLIQPPKLMAHPTTSNIIFMICNNELTNGLYRSDNGGDNWAKLADGKSQLLAPDYGIPGRILWARDDGLYASDDSGETWYALLPDYRMYVNPLYLPTISTKAN